MAKNNTGENNTGEFALSHRPWNVGHSGYKINYPKTRKLKGNLSEVHRLHILLAMPKGKNHYSWKGYRVGYAALHEWIIKQRGQPNECELCGTSTAKRFEWANISGKYLRNIADWKRLCTKCHRKFDKGKKYKAIIQ